MKHNYKQLLMACAIAAAGWLGSAAQSFSEDGIYYNILTESTVEVTNSNGGSSKDATCYSGAVNLPATVTHDGTTYSVVKVGTYAFRGNTAVTSLTLPESVTTLVEYCFAEMTELTYIDIPNVAKMPNYVLYNCSALQTLIFGPGVEEASYFMAHGCTSLTTVKMYNTTPVGWNANMSTSQQNPVAAKPIPNTIQQNAYLYVPKGTKDAYRTKKNDGNGNVTLWNKFQNGTDAGYIEISEEDEVAVTGVTITPAEPVLAAEEGATVQLTATIAPEDATYQTVTWSTSDATVATVDANGLVTRVAALYSADDQPFTATITATAMGGVAATVTVTAQVLATVQPTAVTITPAEPVLAAEAGATVQLTGAVVPENATYPTLTWSSADESVATVDQNGLVTRTAGLYNADVPFTVAITATATNGVSQTVTVTAEVLPTVLPTAITITPAEPVLAAEAGSTVQLAVTFEPEGVTDTAIVWASLDESVATVDANGLVTRTAALVSDDDQPYTAVITATTVNDITRSVTVTADVRGDDFFYEDGLYYNVVSHGDLTAEVTNSNGGTAKDTECYSGDITIPATVTHKGRTYQVVRIGNYAFCESAQVTSLTISEGVQEIAGYGVRGMSGITELVLPESVTSIPAFGLARLSAERVVIPNVANLYQSLLQDCAALKTLELGAGVQTMANYITNNCTAIETVICRATTPPTWDGNTAITAPFNSCINNATLYVPEGCRNAYNNKVASSIYYWRFKTITEITNATELSGVEFTEGHNYATWYGDRALELPDGLKAYVVSEIDGDEAAIVEVGYIPAATGVLLYSESEGSGYSANTYTGTTAIVTSLLVGSTTDTEITDGYLLYGNAFYLAEPGTLPAHRCYLPKPAEGTDAPSRLRLVSGDSVTAIADVNAATATPVRYISITGQVSSTPFSGVNIVVNADGTVSKIIK